MGGPAGHFERVNRPLVVSVQPYADRQSPWEWWGLGDGAAF